MFAQVSPASRHVDRSRVDAVVGRLNALHEEARLDTALRMGRIVVEELFGGDVALLRSRGPRFVGFRLLLEHPGLRVSERQLWRVARV